MSTKQDVVDVLRKVVTRVLLFVWLVTTIVVSIAGPFGTYDALTLPYRLGYWAGVVAASMILAIGFRVLWHIIIRAKPEWLEDLLVIGSLALMFGPMISTLNMSLWPDEVGLVSWQMISFVTFAIGIGTVGVRHIIEQSRAEAVTQCRDRLLDRIGAPAGARLGRVSSDNHHIQIKLTDGTEFRVLMRLRDAVADIDVEPGICVHRSHWIALEQIEKVEEIDGREHVNLPCGSQVPVGPKYRQNLIEVGKLSA